MLTYSFTLILAFLWGAVWAAFLQFKKVGRYLADKRTWITVVIGVGIDLLIALPIVDREEWQRFAGIIAASSVGIITRSVLNEALEEATD